MNSNLKGNIALGKAISYFTEQGYIVSLPLNDSQCYDIIIEKNGQLEMVQVKYTSRQSSSGKYTCGLRTANTKIYYALKDTFCDLLYCYCSNNDEYLIPISKITNNSEIVLMTEYQINKKNENNINKIEYKNFTKPNIIKQYSLDGKYIASYNNYSEAARKIGKNYYGAGNHISDTCKGKRKTAYGYQWKEEF